MSEDANLHMLQLWLGMRELTALGKSIGLPMRHVDTNYLVHCALGELFQDNAPRPFCVESMSGKGDGRHVRVLGYSEVPGKALKAIAKTFASPMLWETSDWTRMASKPMPDCLPKGMRLGFQLRACPVIRKSSSGKEIDAFLDRVQEVDDPDVNIDREEVYREWLTGHFDRRGGAAPVSIRMERFSLERMVRRRQGGSRKARTFKRPAATLAGTLEVTDGDKLNNLLASGIGRHKSFGFGMLKLRRG